MIRRPFFHALKVNGKPMLTPDAISFSYADLDGDDSGRDEAGYMHRFPIRYKVMTCSIEYKSLTEEEKQYTERLFADAPDFEFTCPNRIQSGKLVTARCYRSNYGISWHNAVAGDWRNIKFNIIEC